MRGEREGRWFREKKLSGSDCWRISDCWRNRLIISIEGKDRNFVEFIRLFVAEMMKSIRI